MGGSKNSKEWKTLTLKYVTLKLGNKIDIDLLIKKLQEYKIKHPYDSINYVGTRWKDIAEILINCEML